MACTNCGSDEVELCSCQDGRHSWGVTSASTLVTSASFVLTMSTVGQYGAGWAAVNEHVFIQGFGYYKVVSSTSSTISLTEPASPFVGGAAFAANTIDFQSQAISGNYTITSGTKVTPAGLKGTTGTSGSATSLIAMGSTAAEMSSASQVTNSTASFAIINTTALSAGLLNSNTDGLSIRAKYFYDKNTTGAGNLGYLKITLTEGANTINLTQSLTLFGGGEIGMDGGPMNAPSSGTGGPDFYDIEIVVSRASPTTCNFQLKASPGNMTDYSAEEAGLSKLMDYYIEKTAVSTVTWANAVSVNFLGQVVDSGDEIKLGFFSIEFLNKA